jgi:hypothetical protein
MYPVHSIVPLLYVGFLMFKKLSRYRSDTKNTAYENINEECLQTTNNLHTLKHI